MDIQERKIHFFMVQPMELVNQIIIKAEFCQSLFKNATIPSDITAVHSRSFKIKKRQQERPCLIS
jgi:hypothetical protein